MYYAQKCQPEKLFSFHLAASRVYIGFMRALYFSLCLVVMALVTGCGFTPIHGKFAHSGNGTVQDSLSGIYIVNIPDREGQYLRNTLMDRFYMAGRPADPAYRLEIDTIEQRKTDLDITKSSDATRAQLRLQSKLQLYDARTNALLLQRNLMAITSYNILQSQFTTRVSEQNARENALDDLAGQIERHLTLYFKRS